jgi:hypothetical protein
MIMKRLVTIFIAAVVVMTGFVVVSTSVFSAVKKKDRICINRCIGDYRFCLKKSKDSATYKERISAENECIRQKNICMGVCPDNL